MTITWDEFTKVEMRVGRITRAESFPKAKKPAYKLWIDLGPFGTKRSSAQLTRRYRADELVGRLVVAVTNFPPKRVVDFQSEVLTTGVVVEEGDVVLLRPDVDVPLGSRIL
ncbi:MAG: tRNA-binding protein [Euryarchaeota archaeon]|nr:tRNA-binding protein [Euryarchaeota archaeon]